MVPEVFLLLIDCTFIMQMTFLYHLYTEDSGDRSDIDEATMKSIYEWTLLTYQLFSTTAQKRKQNYRYILQGILCLMMSDNLCDLGRILYHRSIFRPCELLIW